MASGGVNYSQCLLRVFRLLLAATSGGDFSSMDSHKTTQTADVQITNTVETTRQCVQCTCGSYFPYSHTC